MTDLANLAALAEALDGVDSALAAAIGYAMIFAVEDGSGDPVLIDRELAEAAAAFYPVAYQLAERHSNEQGDGEPPAITVHPDGTATVDEPEVDDEMCSVCGKRPAGDLSDVCGRCGGTYV